MDSESLSTAKSLPAITLSFSILKEIKSMESRIEVTFQGNKRQKSYWIDCYKCVSRRGLSLKFTTTLWFPFWFAGSSTE